MDQANLTKALLGLPVGKIAYFDSIGSTNDLAVEWASQGVPDYSIIVADEQTAGRGRQGRKWFTPPGSALAFSTLLRNPERNWLPRTSGLGALAVCLALEKSLGLHPQIKWPNDVLLDGKKVCGVLAEVQWAGENPSSLILGIGINVKASSIVPGEALTFPATCIEDETKQPVSRTGLLVEIVKYLIELKPQLHQDNFITAWEDRLAYRGRWVRIISGQVSSFEGRVQGLKNDGKLRLLLPNEEEIEVQAGEIHLRPLVDI